MLHEKMNISRLMVNSRRVEDTRARRNERVQKGKDLVIVVLQRRGLKSKTILDSRKDSLVKFPQTSRSLVVKRLLILSLKKEE